MTPRQEDRAQLLELARDLMTYLDDQRSTAAGCPEEPPPSLHRETGVENDVESPADLVSLREELGDCRRCGLSETRRHIVFGDGSPDAEIVFVGEAPGEEEDRRGLPFVGAAGTMLTAMISNVLRLEREEVYICNVLKCRPPRNRDPRSEEVEVCSPFLDRQLAAIQPRLVIALGRPAAQHLLSTTAPVGRLRGRVLQRGEIPVIVTYHPAYLLRSPHEKRKAMDDLMLVRSTYENLTGKALPPVRGRRSG